MFNDASFLPAVAVNYSAKARCVIFQPRHVAIERPSPRRDLDGGPDWTENIKGSIRAILRKRVVILGLHQHLTPSVKASEPTL